MLVVMSLGLFGFATVANDIIDWRRDRYLSPDRPLPSGRITLQQAHLLAAALLLMGIGGGLGYAIGQGGGFTSILFLAWVILLIVFQSLAGKFFGAVGLLTLGIIAFFHAAIGQPRLAVIWHPLLIMNHVTVICAATYALEDRRPRLSTSHRRGIAMGLLALNLLLAGAVVLAIAWRKESFAAGFEALHADPPLLYPIIALVIFAVFLLALLLSLRPTPSQSPREIVDIRRQTGRKVFIFGVLWLIVYDMAFIYGYLRQF